MEAESPESLEIEDGEIVDDEADVFPIYNILERPHSKSIVQETTKMPYSDESDNSTDTESDSDSDAAPNHIKRPKLKLKKSKNMYNRNSKNEKYKIWCTQVEEESLTENLVSCGVTNKFYQERSVESYSFPLQYLPKNGQAQNNNSSDEEKETEDRQANKRTNVDRYNVKLRLGRKPNSMDIDNQKGSAKFIPDLTTNADSTNAEVASDIAAKLGEKQDQLIRKVVDTIGKEKAIEFFKKTKTIEERGGMLIINGSRRRTAGGVYLWLVKRDENIPQEQIREIFYIEKKEINKSSNRRTKTHNLIRNLENGPEKDLPALLTRAELSTSEIAEEARFRRGENMDRIQLDSDRTVTNPPPSPATDDPDHSEHTTRLRPVQDYSENLFDVEVDADNMDVF
ncbi:phosphorylated adapter RNA export protein isoform X1 [Prorops nasuta]|uniref:phosphorylated adapter RNA export protein isoform X1 n=2 Tax=Prorops nasuta TaxID=863751 RepID=UPI0034CFC521